MKIKKNSKELVWNGRVRESIFYNYNQVKELVKCESKMWHLWVPYKYLIIICRSSGNNKTQSVIILTRYLAITVYKI